MPRTRWPILIALLLLGGALVASCGDDDDDDDAATATATETETATATEVAEGASVAVSLSEWAVSAAASIDAGEITFNVANAGTSPHEFAVIRSDLAADALPTEAAAVAESDVDLVAKIEEFPAGTTERLTLNLSAGSYVLIATSPATTTSACARRSRSTSRTTPTTERTGAGQPRSLSLHGARAAVVPSAATDSARPNTSPEHEGATRWLTALSAATP